MLAKDQHNLDLFYGAMDYLHWRNLFEKLSSEQRARAAEIWSNISSAMVVELYAPRRHRLDEVTPSEFMEALEYVDVHREEAESLWNDF